MSRVVFVVGRSPFDPFEDTERQRERKREAGNADDSRSPFDPFEDTESRRDARRDRARLTVAAHSIRSRILKGSYSSGNGWNATRRSPFDPFEDTESVGVRRR